MRRVRPAIIPFQVECHFFIIIKGTNRYEINTRGLHTGRHGDLPAHGNISIINILPDGVIGVDRYFTVYFLRLDIRLP